MRVHCVRGTHREGPTQGAGRPADDVTLVASFFSPRSAFRVPARSLPGHSPAWLPFWLSSFWGGSQHLFWEATPEQPQSDLTAPCCCLLSPQRLSNGISTDPSDYFISSSSKASPVLCHFVSLAVAGHRRRHVLVEGGRAVGCAQSPRGYEPLWSNHSPSRSLPTTLHGSPVPGSVLTGSATYKSI